MADGFLAAGRLFHAKAQRLQHAGQHAAVLQVVVHHQDQPARALVADDVVGHVHHRLRHAHLGEEQAHLEARALARFAVHRQLAAHQRGEHAGDGQAEADAVVLAHQVAALEGLEDAFDLLRIDADAGVDDLEAGGLAQVADAQAHLALFGEAHGVAQQVDQDLPHAFLVAAYHGRDASGRLQAKGQALLGGLRGEHALELVDELGEGDFRQLQVQLAGFDLGHVEQAVDQRQQVRATAVDGGQCVLLAFAQGIVALQDLRVAEDAVERCAQLVGQAGDVAALRRVGILGLHLGFLQRFVGLAVGLDLLHQQQGLAVRFLLCHLAALAGQDDPPGEHAGEQREGQEGLEEGLVQRLLHLRRVRHQAVRDLAVDQRQGTEQHQHQQAEKAQVLRQAAVQARNAGPGQQPVQQCVDLLAQAPVWLAGIAAARIQRAAQRADRRAVGRAEGHVLALEAVVAQAAAAGVLRVRWVDQGRRAGARDVVAPAGVPGQQRRAEEGREQRHQRRGGLGQGAEQAEVGQHREQRGDQHGADADRVDVVQVRTLELDVARRQAQRLVDHQVRHQRADPGDGDVGVEAEHLLDRLEHTQLHQHQGDGDVEHQPHHAPRMAVGDAGEEVGPGQRAGVGVGQVDLHLRHDDEQHHGAECPLRRGEHVAEGHQVHLRGFGGTLHGDLVLQGEEGEEGAGEHLQRAGDDPAGPGHEQRGPPAFAVVRGLLRQEAQVVDLLADLRD